MTDAPLPTSTRRRQQWRRLIAGTMMAGSLALVTGCGVVAADQASTSTGTGSSSSTSSGTGGTTLGQGSSTSSHATSQGS